jgi:hypothetical protein
MKKKGFLKSIKSKVLGLETIKEIGEIGDIREWGKSQLQILSKLGGNPIVMKLGN